MAILAVGRVYCDLNFSGINQLPELGQEVFADELTLHAGGGAFITASYLQALGCSPYLMGMLPRSPFGEVVKAEASENQVNIEFCKPEMSAPPQITAAMCLHDERAFLSCRGGPCLPDDYADVIRRCAQEHAVRHLHIGELATLLEYPDLLALARAAKFSVSLDCSWDNASFEHPDIAELISQVDVFLPNQLEMMRLREVGVDETVAPLTVVKQGATGATAYQGGESDFVASQPQAVVDTIGAGDAFNAGFLSAWLTDDPIRQCLSRGVYCGGIAVSTRGGGSASVQVINSYSKV